MDVSVRVSRARAVVATGRRPAVVARIGGISRQAIYRTPLRRPQCAKARSEIFEWIEVWYNRQRLLVDSYDEDWSRLWWVRADGRAQIVGEGLKLERALSLLLDRYPQERGQPPKGPALAVEVERWRCWPAGTFVYAVSVLTNLFVSGDTLVQMHNRRSKRMREELDHHVIVVLGLLWLVQEPGYAISQVAC